MNVINSVTACAVKDPLSIPKRNAVSLVRLERLNLKRAMIRFVDHADLAQRIRMEQCFVLLANATQEPIMWTQTMRHVRNAFRVRSKRLSEEIVLRAVLEQPVLLDQRIIRLAYARQARTWMANKNRACRARLEHIRMSLVVLPVCPTGEFSMQVNSFQCELR
jgi:hypothetical protein